MYLAVFAVSSMLSKIARFTISAIGASKFSNFTVQFCSSSSTHRTRVPSFWLAIPLLSRTMASPGCGSGSGVGSIGFGSGSATPVSRPPRTVPVYLTREAFREALL